MDVSPIQRMAISANRAERVEVPTRVAPAVAVAQAVSASTDTEAAAQRSRNQESSTDVVVAWHAGSLGYVTRIVDKHSGEVLMQTPPEQVLNMVQDVMERLEGGSR